MICLCGCERFHVLVNKFTASEKMEYDRYWEEYQKVYKGGYSTMCTREDDGTVRHWKLVFPGIRIEVFPPKIPPFATVISWRAKCSACGKEHLIFDNRIHGYDGIFCSDGKDKEYIPQYAQRIFRDKAPRRIEITTENDPTLEAFRENTGIKCEYDSYSNAFSWISVSVIDEANKKTKLFDIETA